MLKDFFFLSIFWIMYLSWQVIYLDISHTCAENAKTYILLYTYYICVAIICPHDKNVQHFGMPLHKHTTTADWRNQNEKQKNQANPTHFDIEACSARHREVCFLYANIYMTHSNDLFIRLLPPHIRQRHTFVRETY